ANVVPIKPSSANAASGSQRARIRMGMLLVMKETGLLERIRELRIGGEFPVGQRLEERDHGGLLGVVEVEGPARPAVKVGVRADIPAVMLNNVLQRGESAVVHIRAGQFDVAERG